MKRTAQGAIRALLLVDDPEVAQRYQEAIDPLDVHCDHVQTDRQLMQKLSTQPYNGVLLDMPTAVRLGSTRMNLVRPALSLFPTLRLTYNKRHKKVKALLTGHVHQEGINIPQFILNVCAHFPARTIRSHQRKSLYVRVLVSPGPEFEKGRVQKVTTLDISRGGCFLYAIRPRRVGQDLWLKIIDTNHTSDLIIHCTVRRCVRWTGPPHSPPGMGVSFQELNRQAWVDLNRIIGESSY